MSLRDTLRAIAQGVNKKIVEVPEWAPLHGQEQCEIEVRALTVAMNSVWQALIIDPKIKTDDAEDDEDATVASIARSEASERCIAALLVVCCFDPDTGERLFAEEDVETLMGLSREHKAVIDRLISAAVDLNAFGQKAVEEASKNSKSSPPSGRSSGSGSKAASRRRS